MELVSSRNINHALVDVLDKVVKFGHGITVRDNQDTKEISPLVVNIEQPRERCLVNSARKNNTFAAIAETMWVLAGRNDVDWLENYLPRAKDFSDDGETWRAGYGKRLRDWNGVDQVHEVFKILKKDPSSRRAVMVIFDPDRDYAESKDIPCNNWLHFMIRGGKLNLDVAVRSNDVIWGFSAINTHEWSVLLEVMAHWLNVEVGRLTFFTSSMHLYSRHQERADDILQAEFHDIYTDNSPKLFDFSTDFDEFDLTLEKWFEMERKIRLSNNTKDLAKEIAKFDDPLLRAYLQMLDFYWSLKRNASDEILQSKLEPLKGSDLELAALEFVRRKRPDFAKKSSAQAEKKSTIPKIILIDGADQTGKTYLINELISQIGENNCAYFHNVYYKNFRTAHAAILSAVNEVRDKPFVLVDRWHLSHLIYGQVFKNGQYDESDPLFIDIDTAIDKVIICAVPDYKFDQNLRNEKLPDNEKQAQINKLFLNYAKNDGDKRFMLYNYREHLTHEKLEKFVADFIEGLKVE